MSGSEPPARTGARYRGGMIALGCLLGGFGCIAVFALGALAISSIFGSSSCAQRTAGFVSAAVLLVALLAFAWFVVTSRDEENRYPVRRSLMIGVAVAAILPWPCSMSAAMMASLSIACYPSPPAVVPGARPTP